MTSSGLQAHYLSSHEAAEKLGVTRHQVAMLAKNGEIGSLKIGATLLIDPYSLQQYALLRRGKGRPLSPDVAWASLWLLSGLDAPWLSYQQRRRLLMKLRSIDADDLVWQTRKRATLRVFRADPRTFDKLKTALATSGKSTDRPDIFGMPENTRELEGYARADRLEELIERHGLYEDTSGNVLVHVFASCPWPQGDLTRSTRTPQMPVAVIAADLAASLDARERKAGIAALGILLHALQRS